MFTDQAYKFLFEISPHAVIIADEKGQIQLASPPAEHLFGYGKDELTGQDVALLIPEAQPYLQQIHRGFYAADPELDKTVTRLELFARKKNSSDFPVEITINPLDQSGRIMVAVTVCDISERRLMEQKLSESENRFRNLFNNMLEGVAIIGFDWRFQYVNQTIARHGKLTKEQMVGRTLMEVYPGVERTELFEALEQCMSERAVKHIEVPYLFPGDTSAWYEIHVQPIPEGVFAFILDITKRKIAEDLLVQGEKKYRYLFENNPQPMWIYDLETLAFLNVNQAAIQHYGYSKEEFLQMTIKDIRPQETVSPSLLQAAKAPESYSHAGTWKHQKKNGDVIWVEVYLHSFDYDGHKAKLVLVNDITERKKNELDLNKSMLATQKINKELQQFTYMVSHDLQEPLRMISGFLNLLQSESSEQLTEEAKEYIQYAADGADRMKRLIEDLLQYSRVGTNKEDFIPVDLNELVSYVLLVMHDTIEATDARIAVQSLPVIEANKTLVTQLFQNLIGNALKYRSVEKPHLEIGVKQANGTPVFYIKDNGIGIEPRHFEKIFVVFKRVHTRGPYNGTGIGLAICKKIVEKHGGRIWVESEPGKGSTFYFTLNNWLPNE